jgi:uncharacterized membrane protein
VSAAADRAGAERAHFVEPERGAREGVRSPAAHPWTFLSNHGHVLVCIARDPGIRVRDIAAAVGITERGAQRLVTDLEQAGAITRVREGRRNRYRVHTELPLRHQLEQPSTVGALLASLLER